eukprot:Nk52_evm7s2506 gene=Nk52_evmTU7s2506
MASSKANKSSNGDGRGSVAGTSYSLNGVSKGESDGGRIQKRKHYNPRRAERNAADPSRPYHNSTDSNNAKISAVSSSTTSDAQKLSSSTKNQTQTTTTTTLTNNNGSSSDQVSMKPQRYVSEDFQIPLGPQGKLALEDGEGELDIENTVVLLNFVSKKENKRKQPSRRAKVNQSNSEDRKLCFPLDIKNMKEYNALSENEADFCSTLRIKPELFIKCKSTFISDSRKQGGIKRVHILRAARPLMDELGANKIIRVYDFLIAGGVVIEKP